MSYETSVADAVRQFWAVQRSQQRRRSRTRSSDLGRQRVVGGKHMAGFEAVLADSLLEAGIPLDAVITAGSSDRTLPGYFRATKRWDLLVVSGSRVLAAIELKSISSSFGNNLNNRAEEAIGSTTDFATAFREGTLGNVHRPWIGYVLVMVAKSGTGGSLHPVRVDSPHIEPRAEFVDASYIDRGEQLCRALVQERLCDAAWLLVTSVEHGPDGEFSEPAPDLAGGPFIRLLSGHVRALVE